MGQEKSNSQNSKSLQGMVSISKNSESKINVSSKSSSSNSVIEEETVVYNGSNNNYLCNLSIDGYSLNREFCMENSTYFVQVEEGVTSINVNAEAEDSTAIVCVCENDNLKEGINKVLINVTAENGDVRTYRIYVTVKS